MICFCLPCLRFANLPGIWLLETFDPFRPRLPRRCALPAHSAQPVEGSREQMLPLLLQALAIAFGCHHLETPVVYQSTWPVDLTPSGAFSPYQYTTVPLTCRTRYRFRRFRLMRTVGLEPGIAEKRSLIHPPGRGRHARPSMENNASVIGLLTLSVIYRRAVSHLPVDESREGGTPSLSSNNSAS
jgi:hypothetical protein